MEAKPLKSERVSILICSRDRRTDLERLITALKAIRASNAIEIVVVEETNTPSPIEGVNYIPHPVADRGFPFARNMAIQHASGDILVFLDDDCMIQGDWLTHLLDVFENPDVVGAQGGVTVPKTSNAIGWAESILGFPGGGIARIVQAKGESQTTKEISTLNCAYRKWVIEKVGGFDENMTLGSEDFLLAKQACLHGRCLFVPDALVYHKARGSLEKIWQWFVRRGRAEIRLVKLRKT